MNRLSLSLAVVCLAALAAPAATISASDSGWYDQDGLHNPANNNYFTGLLGGIELRSFYVFNLGGIAPGSITGGTLTLSNRDSTVVGTPLPGTVGSPLTINLYDVTSLLTDVLGGLNGLAVFGDLGGGTLLGTLLVPNDNPGNVVVTLNAAGISYLNTNAGGTIAIGLSLAGLAGSDTYIFANEGTTADFPDVLRRLDLTTATPGASPGDVPEPTTSTLMLGALACLAWWKRSR
jgi:hypothetical protein